MLGAGIRAATLLYPDFSAFINDQSVAQTAGTNPIALFYGCEVAEKWIASRQNDGSGLPQTDSMSSSEPGHYRPDPVSKSSDEYFRRLFRLVPNPASASRIPATGRQKS